MDSVAMPLSESKKTQYHKSDVVFKLVMIAAVVGIFVAYVNVQVQVHQITKVQDEIKKRSVISNPG